MAETQCREEFNITWIQRKKRSGKRKRRSHEEDQGKFRVNSQEKRCPGPGTSMNKETGAGN